MNTTRSAVAAAAAGSLACLLRAGYRDDNSMPIVLVGLFAVWIVAPFAGLLLADRAAARWPPGVRAVLQRMMLIIPLASLAIYGYVALSPPRPKPAVAFVVVPPASLLLLAIALAAAGYSSRKRSG